MITRALSAATAIGVEPVWADDQVYEPSEDDGWHILGQTEYSDANEEFADLAAAAIRRGLRAKWQMTYGQLEADGPFHQVTLTLYVDGGATEYVGTGTTELEALAKAMERMAKG